MISDVIMSEEVCARTLSLAREAVCDYLDNHVHETNSPLLNSISTRLVLAQIQNVAENNWGNLFNPPKENIMDMPNKFTNPVADNEEVVQLDLNAAVENVQSHGLEHLRSRILLAVTAWNSQVGVNNKVEVLTTKFMTEAWPKIVERVTEDVKVDGDNLSQVTWKPISYFLREIYSRESRDVFDGKTYAAILTNGQYVYLQIKESNFYPVAPVGETTEAIPANKVIVLRETTVSLNDATLPTEINIDDSEYVRTTAPSKMKAARNVIKEINNERSFKKSIEKRRKANKSAVKQRRVNRK